MSDAYEVIGLWRYPVKSMAGEAVEAVELDADGVAGDRQWGVRDLDTDRLASAKKPRPFGGLLDWSARITDDGTVEVASPGGQTWTAGDPDLDTVCESADNCPGLHNPDQADTSGKSSFAPCAQGAARVWCRTARTRPCARPSARAAGRPAAPSASA